MPRPWLKPWPKCHGLGMESLNLPLWLPRAGSLETLQVSWSQNQGRRRSQGYECKSNPPSPPPTSQEQLVKCWDTCIECKKKKKKTLHVTTICNEQRVNIRVKVRVRATFRGIVGLGIGQIRKKQRKKKNLGQSQNVFKNKKVEMMQWLSYQISIGR